MRKAKQAKLFKVEMSKSRYGREDSTYTSDVGTIDDLNKYYGYSLEVGASWEHEKGNRKINRNPRGIKSLLTNLHNAKNNSAADGYSGCSFREVPVSKEEVASYWEK